jgi:hypothetical protein
MEEARENSEANKNSPLRVGRSGELSGGVRGDRILSLLGAGAEKNQEKAKSHTKAQDLRCPEGAIACPIAVKRYRERKYYQRFCLVWSRSRKARGKCAKVFLRNGGKK